MTTETTELEWMNELWRVKPSISGRWCIVSEAEWWVSIIDHEGPTDPTGELTARAICAEHNAAVETRRNEANKEPDNA